MRRIIRVLLIFVLFMILIENSILAAGIDVNSIENVIYDPSPRNINVFLLEIMLFTLITLEYIFSKKEKKNIFDNILCVFLGEISIIMMSFFNYNRELNYGRNLNSIGDIIFIILLLYFIIRIIIELKNTKNKRNPIKDLEKKDIKDIILIILIILALIFFEYEFRNILYDAIENCLVYFNGL